MTIEGRLGTRVIALHWCKGIRQLSMDKRLLM
jgi:hypothetical protein